MIGKVDLFRQLTEALVVGAEPRALGLTRQALRQGIGPLEIIDEALRPGLDEVGRRYDNGSCFIPELIIAGRIMQSAMRIIDGVLRNDSEERLCIGRVVLGTVAGDVHTIGKDLVATMLRLNGFEVIDMGFNVPVESFVKRVVEVEASILALSSLLATTRFVQEQAIEALEDAGLRCQVKVIVGGASTSAEWAQRIGADGYAGNAVRAAEVCRELLVDA